MTLLFRLTLFDAGIFHPEGYFWKPRALWVILVSVINKGLTSLTRVLMRIVYFGSSYFGIPSLEALRDSDNELVHIFTQPARPTGRGRKTRPTDAAEWADKNGVNYTEAEDINAPEMIEKISACRPELIVVIAFGQKISDQVISIAKHRAINVHGSLLPEYRGAAPVNRAVMDGREKTGITIITLADRMDAGQMLAKAETDILPDDTAGSVHDRLAEMSADVLINTIKEIEEGTAAYTPQDESKVTIAKKLSKSDGLLDFSLPADRLFNIIRGLYPWPGGQAEYHNKQTGKSERVIIAQTEIAEKHSRNQNPGELDENLNPLCGQGSLKILSIKPAGKGLMDFKAFVNGRNVKPGDYFTRPGS